MLLVYSSGVIATKITSNKVVGAILIGAFMVGIDFLIEPVAIYFQFWTWTSPTVPLLNYIAWFGISVGIGFIFCFFPFEKQNRIAPYVFGVQVLFFLCNNFFIG